MPELNVVDIKGKKSDSIELPKEKFGVHVHDAVIHQAIVMYQANTRQGNASTKNRGEVSGGGKKPWRQKGTGRARAGSSRSPLWKKGGITFGPVPRDFSVAVPKKIRIAALRESLNAKFLSNEIICIDKVEIASGKTKEFAKILENLKVNGKVLALLDGSDEKIFLASRNIARLTLNRATDVNARDILSNKNLLVTKTALETLLKENSIMITPYDIVKSLVRTEKSTSQEKERKYLFRVSTVATKIDIKRAVQEIYKVKVQDVNTVHVPGKLKRVRQRAGYSASWKKAIVSLVEGQKIEVV